MTLSKGDVNSGPGGCGVLELVRTDGPGFSLCAAPLESSGPGFCSMDRGWVNEWRSGGILDWRCRRGLDSEGRGQGCEINRGRGS